MKWTSKEKSALRKQVKAGVSLEEIRVGDRTTFSIRYQLYRMGLVIKSERWSRTEVRLLKNLYMVGIEPHLIEIPGRTKTAIRNKLIRLGVLKTKKRKQKLTILDYILNKQKFKKLYNSRFILLHKKKKTKINTFLSFYLYNFFITKESHSKSFIYFHFYTFINIQKHLG